MSETLESRRNFLKLGLGLVGLVALEACSPYLGKFYEQKQPYYVERKVRRSPLKLNTTNKLRRYKAKPGDPEASESRLVQLARTELVEEHFVFAIPENVWYETGITDKNNNTTSMVNILVQNSGKKPLPQYKTLINYHYHSAFQVAKMVFDYAKLSKEKVEKDYLIKIAFHNSFVPKPPDGEDFDNTIALDYFARKKGIKLIHRLADLDGIWEYQYSDRLMQKYHSGKLSEKEFDAVKRAVVKARMDEFMNKQGTPEGFIQRVRRYLRFGNPQFKFRRDEVKLTYKPIGKPFHLTLDQFRENLKRLKIL